MGATAARREEASPSIRLGRMALDPVLFSRGLLGHNPWGVQGDILRSVASHPRTAVKACHASGKTYCAADAVLWWTLRYPDGVVVTTAPTWTQVEKLLWGEIRRSVSGARIQLPPLNKTELPIGPDNYAIGLSTNEGVRFQGWHGRILIVLDEAPGVLPEIYEAIEGIRAGGHVHVLLLGNPILPSGAFHDAFTTQRSSWNTFTISAFDTPNFAGVTLERLMAMTPTELAFAPRPYLTTRAWVREKYEEWGPSHPLWESKVLGQFPTQSEDSLLSLAWLERAKARKDPRPISPTDILDAGIDVAGPGEAETTLYLRRGQDLLPPKTWTKRDPRGEVLAELRPYKGRVRVRVDSIGIGYYFAQHLRDEGFEVYEINVGERDGVDTEKYVNRKAELYWGLRKRFESGDVGGLTDETTIGQLAGIRYRHTARGQVEIESKQEAAARGMKSPDRAEGLMLSYAPDPTPKKRDLSKPFPVIQR